MESRDVIGGNIEKIAALFPHCVTERLDKDGKPELAIDFDQLRAELWNDVLETVRSVINSLGPINMPHHALPMKRPPKHFVQILKPKS